MESIHLNAPVRTGGAFWRCSWTDDSGNQSTPARFVACYVLKVNLNSPNMHEPSWPRIAAHSGKWKCAGPKRELTKELIRCLIKTT
jgi:hypothetical protein